MARALIDRGFIAKAILNRLDTLNTSSEIFQVLALGEQPDIDPVFILSLDAMTLTREERPNQDGQADIGTAVVRIGLEASRSEAADSAWNVDYYAALVEEVLDDYALRDDTSTHEIVVRNVASELQAAVVEERTYIVGLITATVWVKRDSGRTVTNANP